ncbi:MAG: hypothetical protein ISR95_07205 [Candidatus Marinimicrobia bacterium]|nr:hypothetical protein [Candidatus Neomarinimicrobiota bacterium]
MRGFFFSTRVEFKFKKGQPAYFGAHHYSDATYDIHTRYGIIDTGNRLKFWNWNWTGYYYKLLRENSEWDTDYLYPAYFKSQASIRVYADYGIPEILDPWSVTSLSEYDIDEDPLTWKLPDSQYYLVFPNESQSGRRYSVKTQKYIVDDYQYYEFDDWYLSNCTTYSYSGEPTVDTDEWEVTDVKFTNNGNYIRADYTACGDGDVTGGDDGADVLDIVAIISFLLGNTDPTPTQEFESDLNCDDINDILDVVILVEFILEESPSGCPDGDILFSSIIEEVNQDSSYLDIIVANETWINGIQIEMDVEDFGLNDES